MLRVFSVRSVERDVFAFCLVVCAACVQNSSPSHQAVGRLAVWILRFVGWRLSALFIGFFAQWGVSGRPFPSLFFLLSQRLGALFLDCSARSAGGWAYFWLDFPNGRALFFLVFPPSWLASSQFVARNILPRWLAAGRLVPSIVCLVGCSQASKSENCLYFSWPLARSSLAAPLGRLAVGASFLGCSTLLRERFVFGILHSGGFGGGCGVGLGA